MKIKIEYDSIWNNSFLDGDNNTDIPKNGRKYIASSSGLKDPNNFKKKEITKDTVMGVLNLLIGGRDKLHRLRKREDYFFKDKEERIFFENCIENKNMEVSFLRNFNNSTDQNSFCGQLNYNHPLFSSDFSLELWSILFCDINDVCSYILNNNPINIISEVSPDLIIERIEKISKEESQFYKKGYEQKSFYKELLNLNKYIEALNENWSNGYNGLKNNKISFSSIYFTALYKKIYELKSRGFNLKENIPGFSKNGLTKKDFYSFISSGGKKKVYGNPYIFKIKKRGAGEIVEYLTKTSGKLTITLNLTKEESLDLKDKIESAGVLTFPLGKKGLAYIERIEI
jgi:hypothetical protein